MDPRVLSVIATPASEGGGIEFPLNSTRIVHDAGVERVRFTLLGETFRFDVVEGLITGPVEITYALPHDARLPIRLDTIRRFAAMLAGCPLRQPRVSGFKFGLAIALAAWDARADGASLREAAEMLWGPGDWPGDGEHRKSAVRRLILLGQKLVNDGPEPILAGPRSAPKSMRDPASGKDRPAALARSSPVP